MRSIVVVFTIFSGLACAPSVAAVPYPDDEPAPGDDRSAGIELKADTCVPSEPTFAIAQATEGLWVRAKAGERETLWRIQAGGLEPREMPITVEIRATLVEIGEASLDLQSRLISGAVLRVDASAGRTEFVLLDAKTGTILTRGAAEGHVQVLGTTSDSVVWVLEREEKFDGLNWSLVRQEAGSWTFSNRHLMEARDVECEAATRSPEASSASPWQSGAAS